MTILLAATVDAGCGHDLGQFGWGDVVMAADRPKMADEAADKARQLLASHEVPPLADEQRLALEEVIRAVLDSEAK